MLFTVITAAGVTAALSDTDVVVVSIMTSFGTNVVETCDVGSESDNEAMGIEEGTNMCCLQLPGLTTCKVHNSASATLYVICIYSYTV